MITVCQEGVDWVSKSICLSDNFYVKWDKRVGLGREITEELGVGRFEWQTVSSPYRVNITIRTVFHGEYDVKEIIRRLTKTSSDSWEWLARINFWNVSKEEKEQLKPILLSIILTETGKHADLTRNIAKYYLKEWFDEC